MNRRRFLGLSAAAAGLAAPRWTRAGTSPPEIGCSGSSTASSIDLIVSATSGPLSRIRIDWITEATFTANGGAFTSDPYYAILDVTIPEGDSAVVRIPPDTTGSVIDACGIEVPLECDTNYVIRVASFVFPLVYSDSVVCRTARCGETGGGSGCTYTIGYWMTHGPIPTGNNRNEWPVNSLTLGSVDYTDFQALQILKNAPKGNGLITLARQLIGAKLNVANGADPSAVAAAIGAADALIGSRVVPPVGDGRLSAAAVSALNDTLTKYNEGVIGPGHCDDGGSTGGGGGGSVSNPAGCEVR